MQDSVVCHTHAFRLRRYAVSEKENTMKSIPQSLSTGIAASAVSLCLAISAFAQFNALTVPTPAAVVPTGAAASAENIINIRSLTEPKDASQRATPLGNRSGRQKQWGVFDVTFDTAPEWLDEITITYTVLLNNPKAKPGEKQMSLYTFTADYADVAMGREHKAGVVLPPAALLRYGAPIGFAVKISVGGRTVERGTPDKIGNIAKWWSDPAVTSHQNVQKREGLMERGKSPFALVDIDSYEVAK